MFAFVGVASNNRALEHVLPSTYNSLTFRPHRMHSIDAYVADWSLCLSVCLFIWMRMYPAKTAEPIEMLLGMWSRVDPG